MGRMEGNKGGNEERGMRRDIVKTLSRIGRGGGGCVCVCVCVSLLQSKKKQKKNIAFSHPWDEGMGMGGR